MQLSTLPWPRVLAWILSRPTWLKAGTVVFLASVFQAPATPLFDAASYWGGSVALAHFNSPWSIGALGLRGVWTSVLYLPAALPAGLVSTQTGVFFILLENSVALGLLGAVLLPAFVGQWRPLTPAVTWTTAGITWLIIGRYVPYSLTDFLEVVTVMSAALLLAKQNRWLLGAGGALLFIAANSRPAYLAVAAFLLALALWFRRKQVWQIWPAAVGAVLAAIPQSYINIVHHFSWKPWPVDTSVLSAQQSLWASFFVRYDTVIDGSARASLTWCDPHIARLAAHNPPHSTTGLLIFFLKHPTGSVPFVLEKFGSVLSWPIAAPYYSRSQVANLAFSGIVIGVTVIGIVSVCSSRPFTQLRASVWAIWIGGLLVIATAAPETRFSLPIVACGIIGVVAGTKWTLRKSCLTIGIAALLVAAALVGMSHPVATNAIAPKICAKA